ncbi:hypothetical protein [Bradyrhizobium sp. 190]|uniref:hypothetical protein n=1 Tax=Bradyrhizobium sp. 190 TaxID=2782658 RepID=UPI001FF8D937|nr:hypothetical protein [Bradyrhizobium sp. 190]
MWLLGAGASAAASIPTAWDMIWEFKQQLYVRQRRVSPKQVAELFTPGRSGHVSTASATAALIAAAVAGAAHVQKLLDCCSQMGAFARQ